MKRLIGNIWIFLLSIKNILRPKQKLIPNNLKNILVIELSRMGDVISMIYAVLCLMGNFSKATFIFAVDQKYQNLLKTLLEFHKVNIARVKIFGFKATDTFKGLRLTKLELNNLKYDLICSMSPSFRNGFLALSLNSTFKIGFFRSNSIYTPFLEKNRVDAIGIKNFTSKSFLNENIQERGFKICSSLELKSDVKLNMINFNKIKSLNNIKNNYIILHPFAGWEYRSWNYLNYVQLIKNIIAKFDVTIFVIGSQEEKMIGEEICNLAGGKNVYPVFEENLDKILNLMPGAKLFIGNDSGPLHLASIFNVPIVGIYGPAPPELTAPKGNINFYFYRKLECSPCRQIDCIRPENTCMDQISVEEVTKKVFEYLNFNSNLNE